VYSVLNTRDAFGCFTRSAARPTAKYGSDSQPKCKIVPREKFHHIQCQAFGLWNITLKVTKNHVVDFKFLNVNWLWLQCSGGHADNVL
jgi:hypothetical protein